MWIGYRPDLDGTLASAPFSSSFTTVAVWPYCAATNSGVYPSKQAPEKPGTQRTRTVVGGVHVGPVPDQQVDALEVPFE